MIDIIGLVEYFRKGWVLDSMSYKVFFLLLGY